MKGVMTMSTRAIIGIKNEDGSITGAWQWNDGGNLTSLLNKNFNTIEKATEIINEGMWSTMFTNKGAEKHERWLKDELHKEENENIPPRQYTKIYDIQLLKHEGYYQRPPARYESFEDAMGQDINYLYLFNKNTNKWERYR